VGVSAEPSSRLNHVSVTTADLDRSLGFYRDLLGLRQLGRGETASPQLAKIIGLGPVRLRWAELAIDGDRFLELFRYLQPDGSPLRQRTSDLGCMHFALSVSDLDQLYERLLEGGFAPRSKPVELLEGDWTGARVTYAPDPDGATVELIEFGRSEEGQLGNLA
jgi:glyoxylase I family protein